MYKVLHINCSYLGTTLHQTMIEFLEKKDISNIVFVPTYDKNVAVIKPNDNVDVSECFKKYDRISFYYKQNKILKSLLEKYIDINEFNIIHAYTLFSDGNIAMSLNKTTGIPYIVAVRNTDVNAFFKYRPYLRKKGLEIMERASAIIFLSDAYKKQVYQKYIPNEKRESLLKKTIIIPNGIDPFWLINKQSNFIEFDNSKVIKLIYAGKIDSNKNIITTQKAIDILYDKGYKVQYTVVGKVIEKKLYHQIVKHKYTTVLEPVNKELLMKLYRSHHIFVMPSFTESFGLVYAEAMSQGLPVIYTNGQGFDGQFKEGEVGYSVNPTNPQEIAEKIIKITKNYNDFSTRSSENSSKFDWNKIVLKYGELYDISKNIEK